MSRVSLEVIAAELGISAMTVSRALRGRPGVSAELRQRVREVAERLGYRQDPEIGRLMHHLRYAEKEGSNAVLCAVTDFPQESEPRYCKRLHQNASIRAEELGYAFTVVRVTRGKGGWRAALRTIRARGIEGILISPLVVQSALDGENWEDFSVVLATSSVTAPRFHEVVPNHSANARLVVDQLVAQKHQRLGFVGLSTHVQRTRESFLTALAWHHARHGVNCAPLMYEPDKVPDILPWLRSERPDVVIVGRATDLPRFRDEAAKAGIRVPFTQANSRAFFDFGPGLDERDDLSA